MANGDELRLQPMQRVVLHLLRLAGGPQGREKGHFLLVSATSHICLNNVNLHYPVLTYTHRSLAEMVAQLIGKGRRAIPLKDIHALKNISTEIRHGERVALLGHNGAGKTTFLKVVAGLYPISSGRVDVVGGVRSLFDISLGFEPDATGRANILYRGLLLGLSPGFVRAREDEIVAFADL